MGSLILYHCTINSTSTITLLGAPNNGKKMHQPVEVEFMQSKLYFVYFGYGYRKMAVKYIIGELK